MKTTSKSHMLIFHDMLLKLDFTSECSSWLSPFIIHISSDWDDVIRRSSNTENETCAGAASIAY